MKNLIRLSLMIFTLALIVPNALAQTTAFNYQGRLTDGGNPASGAFQMQFKLFDALTGGAQIGTTLTDVPVTAANGIFSVKLDFGANAFSGANRWLEIAVRRNANESYILLTPREQIASSPYAVRTLSAQTADLALDAQKLGGINASEYVTNANAGGSFIRNSTTLQTANLNISGNGIFGGNVGIGITNPANRLDVFGGVRSLFNGSTGMLAETTGGTNSWAKFSMKTPNRLWSIGTTQNFNNDQFYLVDETAGQIRMAVSTGGFVGINNVNPQTGLDIRGTGSQVQQRITDNTSGNSLVLQGGAGANTKVTGFNYNTNSAVPLYLSTDGANTVMNSGGGNVLQPGAGYGLPKAMVFVLANGVISRCYNGLTGVSMTGGTTNTGCGFTSSVTGGTPGRYIMNFGFNLTDRFFSLAVYGGTNNKAGYLASAGGANPNSISVFTFLNDQGNLDGVVSDYYLIVY